MKNGEILLTASSLEDIKRYIEEGIKKKLVLWDAKSNRMRSEIIDGMPYRFNFLPALAKKTLVTKMKRDTCFLCDFDPEQTIQLIEPSNPKLRINNFPYHETQTLFSEREHVPFLTQEMMIESLRICNKYRLNCAFSSHNVGASFPEHAHIHMFASELPLYDLSPEWHSGLPIKTGTINEYPASILVIESTQPELIIKMFLYLLENIESDLYGYNLQYSSRNKRLFFFPRQTGASKVFDGQVFGAPTVSGVFTPDARGYIGNSIEDAIEVIKKRYSEITGKKIKLAIEELVFPKEFNLDVIIPNLRQP